MTSAVYGGKVTAEMKFSDGTRNVVLSDLVYGEDWVLSLEMKEGAAKSKKNSQLQARKPPKPQERDQKVRGKERRRRRGKKGPAFLGVLFYRL